MQAYVTNAKKILNNNKIIVFILLTILVLLTTFAIIFMDSNLQSSASQATIISYKPEQIIEGETVAILLNGDNFTSTCKVLLGEMPLQINFLNSQSIEVTLPTTLKSTTLTLNCQGQSKTIELSIKPRLTSLPT